MTENTQIIYKETPIILEESLVKKGYEIGEQRYLNSRANGVHNAQRSNGHWLTLDGEGACGEIAFAQLTGVLDSQWDRLNDSEIKCAKTDLGDIEYCGMNFDVKTTKYHTGHLIITRSKFQNLTEGYALITGFKGDYVFKGVISKHRIKMELMNFKIENGDVWIPQSYLRDLKFF
jgi:hypothetical protein